jgi:hypothetical protein
MSINLSSLLPAVAHLDTLTQDNTLVRVFQQALYPELLFRAEAEPKPWPAQAGEEQVFTKSTEPEVNTDPLLPGEDPTPVNDQYEQYKVRCAEYPKVATDVNMAVSRMTLASLFLDKIRNQGRLAGRTMNRLARNALFVAYGTGQTIADTGGAPTTSFNVASIAGFTHGVTSGGSLDSVSSSNGKAFYVNGTLITGTAIIAAAAIDPNFPLGRGTLTLSGAGTTIVAGDAIRAADAPYIHRSGGGHSVDAISLTDTLKMVDLRFAVSALQTNRVPPHADGSYHGHLSSLASAQIFGDSEFQALHDGSPYSERYAMFAVGKILNCTFYRDEEVPRYDASGRGNVGDLQVSRPASATSARLGKEIGAEVINQGGVRIVRTIITGGEALMEMYVPEQDYVTEAGTTGVIRPLELITPQAASMTVERVRFIIRAPLDRRQQMVSMTWSWAGDFGVPSDARAMYTGSRYKRCIVIESADNLI